MAEAKKRPAGAGALLPGGAAIGVAVLLAVTAAGGRATLSTAEEARAIPLPAVDEPEGQSAAPEVAVVAGGCFWGVQGVFQHVEGVSSAVSGYAGGDQATAEYPVVSAGGTGHAESVRITYDPRRISYGLLVRVSFSVAPGPTPRHR